MQTATSLGELRQNNFIEKLVRRKTFWITFWILAFSYPLVKSIYRELPKPLPVYYSLPEYSLTNQFNKSFGSKNLRGKVYIASFVFSNCPTVCPKMLKKMQKIQKRVRGLSTGIGLVTFSVDPKNDTPKVLYKLSRKLHANPHVWSFLTGDEKSIEKLLINNFKLPMGKSDNVYDFAHSKKLVLVDKEGNIRGYYNSDKDDVNRLMIDVGLLINNAFKSETKS